MVLYQGLSVSLMNLLLFDAELRATVNQVLLLDKLQSHLRVELSKVTFVWPSVHINLADHALNTSRWTITVD